MQYTPKALQLKAELDLLRPISREQELRIMQKFRLDWNYHSNHLEGNSLTFGETKALILHGITAQGKPLKDHFEITGHDEAIKWVEDIVKGEMPLTENFIRELHTLLLKEPYERPAITADGQPTTKKIKVGEYKSTPNHVRTQTGEIFYFASPEETPAKMYDLLNWYRAESDLADTNLILLAAEFHYRFIRIHPFDDGNGRTARILMNFILMKAGFPPVIIQTNDKTNYFSALRQADGGNITAFIEYISQNLCNSLAIMIAGAKGESIEEADDWEKELALLKHSLKGSGDKAEVVKSEEVLKNLYDNSIQALFERFIEKAKKFADFYVGNIVSIDGPSNINFYQENQDTIDFSVLTSKFDGNERKLKLYYSYQTFRQIGFNEFSYGSGIDITFNTITYKITYQDISIEKPYSEQLTEQEINHIIATEMKHHTAFIQQKIKEKR